MTTNFDNAIPDLVATAESIDGFTAVRKACAVRDLRGRVRLVVDPPETLKIADLSEALVKRLGRWFHGPVISTLGESAAERRLAVEIMKRSESWPDGWPTHLTDVTGAKHKIPPRWSGYQRVLSKQAWLDGIPGNGAWPLAKNQPVIAAFYSFKGGVGRSTVLAIVAWQLARAGKKVVCVDLDVEAPGLGSLFDINDDASVMEYLLTHAATGQTPSEDPVHTSTVHGATIDVVPAGALGRSYLEKLGRLDYLGTATAQDSPVGRALLVLLNQIRGQHSPDYIFLDCRAGIHDLGGLSLNDLAHVDVLVGRDTPQGRDGLALTLQVLETHRAPQDRRILIVQTFVPLPLEGDAGQLSRARFRRAMYEACEMTLYRELGDLPGEEDTEVAHYAWPVGQLDELASCQKLEDVSEGTLKLSMFQDIRTRLEALAAPEGRNFEEYGDGVDQQ